MKQLPKNRFKKLSRQLAQLERQGKRLIAAGQSWKLVEDYLQTEIIARFEPAYPDRRFGAIHARAALALERIRNFERLRKLNNEPPK
jgi:hypothetical protein